MQNCPYCAEKIQDKALICKHCKNELPKAKQKQTSALVITDSDKKLLKWIWIGLLAIIAIWFWEISIPISLVWLIWKKSKWNKKKKYIGTVLSIALFGVFVGFSSYLSRVPSFTITEPDDGFTIQSSETTIKGTIDPKNVRFEINGNIVKTENGIFKKQVNLTDEKNIFTIKVSNVNGQFKKKLTINRTFTDEEIAESERLRTEEETRRQAVLEANKKAEEERIAQELSEQKKWERSKAGRICKAHPEWSKSDCEGLANNKIWIGMTFNMLKYLRGLPSSANPSNYGSGTRWQLCWHNYTPLCFYDDDNDGLIDSYN